MSEEQGVLFTPPPSTALQEGACSSTLFPKSSVTKVNLGAVVVGWGIVKNEEIR